MTRRHSRTYPVPHLFMLVSAVLLVMMVSLMAASAEVVEGSCTGTVTIDGEFVTDADRSAAAPGRSGSRHRSGETPVAASC